jgi:hypothetical protein
MGWDVFQKLYIPWDGMASKIFHPIPSHGTKIFQKASHPWMGWDGMGLSHPTRSPAMQPFFSLINFSDEPIK